MHGVDLFGCGEHRFFRGTPERCHKVLELSRAGHLQDSGGFGSDLESVSEAARKPDHSTGVMHRFNISARKPDLTIEDVQEFILGIVAV